MVEQVGGTRGPAYALRLESLLPPGAAVLEAVCLLCRHAAALDVAALVARFSRHERLVVLEDRLACSACGARGQGVCKLRVTWRG